MAWKDLSPKDRIEWMAAHKAAHPNSSYRDAVDKYKTGNDDIAYPKDEEWDSPLKNHYKMSPYPANESRGWDNSDNAKFYRDEKEINSEGYSRDEYFNEMPTEEDYELSKIHKGTKEGVSFNKNLQQFGDGGIIKGDQDGYRNPNNRGKIVEIKGNIMGTNGYGNTPLYVVPNNDEPRIVNANTGNHVFSNSTKFTEYPIKKYQDGGGTLPKNDATHYITDNLPDYYLHKNRHDDSLLLDEYTKLQHKLEPFGPFGTNRNDNRDRDQQLLFDKAKEMIKRPGFTWGLYGNRMTDQKRNLENYTKSGSPDVLNNRIKPTGTWFGEASNNEYTNITPTQQVIYQPKPQVKPDIQDRLILSKTPNKPIIKQESKPIPPVSEVVKQHIIPVKPKEELRTTPQYGYQPHPGWSNQQGDTSYFIDNPDGTRDFPTPQKWQNDTIGKPNQVKKYKWGGNTEDDDPKPKYSMSYDNQYNQQNDNINNQYSNDIKQTTNSALYNKQKMEDYYATLNDSNADIKFREKYQTSPHRYRYDNDPKYKQEIDSTAQAAKSKVYQTANVDPNAMFMLPNKNISGQAAADYQNFHKELISNFIPIPGIAELSKGKNVVKEEQVGKSIYDKVIYPNKETKLSKDLEPYLSKKILSESDQDKVFNSFLTPEAQAKKLKERTINYDKDGNIIKRNIQESRFDHNLKNNPNLAWRDEGDGLLKPYNTKSEKLLQEEYVDNLKSYYDSPEFNRIMNEHYPDVNIETYKQKTLQNLENPITYNPEATGNNLGVYRSKSSSNAVYVPGHNPTFKQKVNNANTNLYSSDDMGKSSLRVFDATDHELSHQRTNSNELLPEFLTDDFLKKSVKPEINNELEVVKDLGKNSVQYDNFKFVFALL